MKLNVNYEKFYINENGSMSIVFTAESKNLARNCVDKIDKDKLLTIDINRFKKSRTVDANAYFHLLVNEIAEIQKIGNDECKIKMNLEYGTLARMSNGNIYAIQIPKGEDISKFYPYAKWYGEINDDGVLKDKYMFYKRTHELDTKEMARLIDGVVYEAKELGIETKTPEQIEEMKSLWGDK